MEAIEQKVRVTLFAYFAPEEIQFEANADDRVSGIIVSSKFDGKNDLARRRKIGGTVTKDIIPSRATKDRGISGLYSRRVRGL